MWDQTVCGGKVKDNNPKEINHGSFCHKHFIGAIIPFFWKTEVKEGVINFSDFEIYFMHTQRVCSAESQPCMNFLL